MTNPTNTDLAAALREIADTLPLGSQLIVRLAADRLDEYGDAEVLGEHDPDKDPWMDGLSGGEWIAHDGKGAPKNLNPEDQVWTKRGTYTDREPSTVKWWDGNGTPDQSNWIWPEEGPGEDFITHYRLSRP